MSAMDDWFAKNMPDTEAWITQFAAETVVAQPNVVPARDGFLVPPGMLEGLSEAVKLSSYMDVPNELLMDHGLIPDTRPPRPPTPWRWRLRNRITDWREQAARRAYKTIAGYWPASGEDDW